MTFTEWTPAFSRFAVASNQVDLNEGKSGAKLASDGISRALDAAGVTWQKKALREIKRLATSQQTICSDDVVMPKGHENAAGGIFRMAAARKWIKHDGYKKSEKQSRHGAVVAVWKSRLYTP